MAVAVAGGNQLRLSFARPTSSAPLRDLGPVNKISGLATGRHEQKSSA
jgi:hypothetical protein